MSLITETDTLIFAAICCFASSASAMDRICKKSENSVRILEDNNFVNYVYPQYLLISATKE